MLPAQPDAVAQELAGPGFRQEQPEVPRVSWEQPLARSAPQLQALSQRAQKHRLRGGPQASLLLRLPWPVYPLRRPLPSRPAR